ncbi:N-glycosylation protein-domain-containing protein [Mycena floridula]|nr:N-glycosylation protein-domain-containing protein [Mycena floridula]
MSSSRVHDIAKLQLSQISELHRSVPQLQPTQLPDITPRSSAQFRRSLEFTVSSPVIRQTCPSTSLPHTVAHTPTSTSRPPAGFLVKKSKSSPVIQHSSPFPHYNHSRYYMGSDNDDEDVIYTSWRSSSSTNLANSSSNLASSMGSSGNLRASRPQSGSVQRRNHDKPICTNPSIQGAGETETEGEEPPRHLPTSRKIPLSSPLIPPNRFTPVLFEASRLLSIVPALFGIMFNLHRMVYGGMVSRIDYFVSALWAILTLHQSLSLATGLYFRWRLYYTPLPTLIRLLALQAICWPALHLTLNILDVEKRPVVAWAIVGTTTSVSRSVQIWVTSNLWEETPGDRGSDRGERWRGGKWGGRRWDWRQVGIKCMLPVGMLYFVMAWAEQIRRELEGC